MQLRALNRWLASPHREGWNGDGEHRIHFVALAPVFTWVCGSPPLQGNSVSAFGLPDWLETKCIAATIPRVKGPKFSNRCFFVECHSWSCQQRRCLFVIWKR